MHQWGDEWFKKNGDDLYRAIDYIENNLRKHHIGVYGKEKFGTWRDEYLTFWNGGLYQILWGYRMYIGTSHQYPKWLKKIVNSFHKFIYFNIDLGDTWFWPGLITINSWLGLTQLIQKHQAKTYNKYVQLACKLWPNVKYELICAANGSNMVKPCKYGDLDAEKYIKDINTSNVQNSKKDKKC